MLLLGWLYIYCIVPSSKIAKLIFLWNWPFSPLVRSDWRGAYSIREVEFPTAQRTVLRIRIQSRCCVGSYLRIYIMIFWSIIISKTLIEIWLNFQTLLRLINCTTYQNFIRFYLVVRLLTWVKNPGMETFSMILPLTPNHGGDWRIHKKQVSF